MLTTAELLIIVGICMILIPPFLGFKTKYKFVFIFCGLFLVTTNIYFAEAKSTLLSILNIIAIIFPFLLVKIRSDDVLKEKYK